MNVKPMILSVAVALGAAACTGPVNLSMSAVPSSDTTLEVSADSAQRATSRSDAASQTPDERLAELKKKGYCDPSQVEGDGYIGTATAIHVVTDGKLGPSCSGKPDPRLAEAWKKLSLVARPEDLAKIDLFAGYEACEDCNVAAFVQTPDKGGKYFMMAVDLTLAESNPDELIQTLVHELGHVITMDPHTQIDTRVPSEKCDTFDDGSGCARKDSYLAAWVKEFWPGEVMAKYEADPYSEEGSQDRCSNKAGYTGLYAATSPEEDFSESLSAYVFNLDLPPEMDAKLAFFDRYPEFKEMRQRAEQQGWSRLPHFHEGCSGTAW